MLPCQSIASHHNVKLKDNLRGHLDGRMRDPEPEIRISGEALATEQNPDYFSAAERMSPEFEPDG